MQPIICEICLEAFSEPANYLSHYRDNHEEEEEEGMPYFDSLPVEIQNLAIEYLAYELVDSYMDNYKVNKEDRDYLEARLLSTLVGAPKSMNAEQYVDKYKELKGDDLNEDYF